MPTRRWTLVVTGLTAAAAAAGTVGAVAAPGAAARPETVVAVAPAAAAPAERSTPGASFIGALADGRFGAARALLAPDVEFKALTPSAGFIDLRGRTAVMKLMREWYGTAEEAERIQSGRVVDRRFVDYRIRWSTPADGTMVFGQHAFYDLDGEGRISRMHLVCSGDRPSS